MIRALNRKIYKKQPRVINKYIKYSHKSMWIFSLIFLIKCLLKMLYRSSCFDIYNQYPWYYLGYKDQKQDFIFRPVHNDHYDGDDDLKVNEALNDEVVVVHSFDEAEFFEVYQIAQVGWFYLFIRCVIGSSRSFYWDLSDVGTVGFPRLLNCLFL